MRKLTYAAAPLVLLVGALLAAVFLPQQISLWKDREERNMMYVKEIAPEERKTLSITEKMRLLWDMTSVPDALGRKETHSISDEADDSLSDEVETMLRQELSAWQDGGILPESVDIQDFFCSEDRIIRYYDTANRLQMTTYDLYAEDAQGNAVRMVLDADTGRGLQAEVRLAQEKFLAETSEAVGEWYFDSLRVTTVFRPASEDTAWFAMENENLVYRITLESEGQQISIVPVGLMSQIWDQNEDDATLMGKGG